MYNLADYTHTFTNSIICQNKDMYVGMPRKYGGIVLE